MKKNVVLRPTPYQAQWLYAVLYDPQDGPNGDEIRLAKKLQRRIAKAQTKAEKR